MKKITWSILFISASSLKRVKRIPANRFLVFLLIVFVTMGALGLGRCIYFASSYGLAKLGMYYNLKENRQLKLKLQFLTRFAREGENRIDNLVNFEDRIRLKFGMEQISNDIRRAGVGGSPNSVDILLASLDDPVILKADTIKENILSLLRRIRIEDTTFSKMAGVVDSKCEMWAQRPAVSPVWGRLTSFFGYRIHPFTGYNVFHEGIDISNNVGTPIHATAEGIVSFVGYKDYFGNVVVINHPSSGYKTVFAHLLRPTVIEGQVVKRSDLIGYMGNSGRSTGPHLHYEVHRLSDMVNPMDCILPTDTLVD
jgi:murein DD-endopeptidase MepM/ murein hydrolase activator NlpD